jgi:hypothetical protein
MPPIPSDSNATPAAPGSAPWFADPELKFVTPQLKRALDVWRAKCGARTMPARGDLTIRDLVFTLPNIGFVDIVRENDGMRFKVRLMGSLLDEFVAPMTGRFVDQAVPERFATKWATHWQPAIDHRAPLRAVARVEFAERRWYVSEALHAPLAQDGETPDVLMIAAYFHSTEGFEGRSRDMAERLQRELTERAAAVAA